MSRHYKTVAVICPHCDHEYTSDDMLECKTDLYGLAPAEESAEIQCPVCDRTFAVKGGYRPQYTTAIVPELLFYDGE